MKTNKIYENDKNLRIQHTHLPHSYRKMLSIVDLLTTKNVSIGPNLVTVIKFHTIVLYSVNEHFRWVGTFRISNYPILGQFHH